MSRESKGQTKLGRELGAIRRGAQNPDRRLRSRSRDGANRMLRRGRPQQAQQLENILSETLAPAWRELLIAFRRMEARGEIRGGRFVDGFLGEQFALPEAVVALRDMRRATVTTALVVAAADPLNLAGIVTPGPRVSSLAGGSVEILPAPEAIPAAS